ncbi:MAG: hypothetical protein OXQ31_14330 [Spirochaetaceae bacterium]|nr:hypothetical protein [Spirochaetaceae bacterium]
MTRVELDALNDKAAVVGFVFEYPGGAEPLTVYRLNRTRHGEPAERFGDSGEAWDWLSDEYARSVPGYDPNPG